VIILSVIAFLRLTKATTVEGPPKLLILITVISLIGLVATGGLLSFDRFAKLIIVVLHGILAGTAGISIILLLFKHFKKVMQ